MGARHTGTVEAGTIAMEIAGIATKESRRRSISVAFNQFQCDVPTNRRGCVGAPSRTGIQVQVSEGDTDSRRLDGLAGAMALAPLHHAAAAFGASFAGAVLHIA